MASLEGVCQLDAANCLSIHAVAVLVLLVAVAGLLGFSYSSSSTSTSGSKGPSPAATEARHAPSKLKTAVRAGTTTLHANPYLRVEVYNVLGWGSASTVFKGERHS